MKRFLLPLLFALLTASGGAGQVDHSSYDALLHERVSFGQVDYVALREDARLGAYIASLAAIDPSALSQSEGIAYWLNAYNALTLRLMAEAWPVESIQKINDGKPFDLPLFKPLGYDKPLTLNQIENDILRKHFTEPRVHFALVCAATSCPLLRSEAYLPDRLSIQLTGQATSFLRDSARNSYDPATHTLRLSPVFQWYANDFGGPDALSKFVMPFLPVPDRASMALAGRAPTVVFEDYDWSPNAAPPPEPKPPGR